MKAYKIAWTTNAITRAKKISPFKALHLALQKCGLRYKGILSTASDEIVVAVGNRKATTLLTLQGKTWTV